MIDVSDWYKTNTFHHSAFSWATIGKAKRQTVSVCLPTREVAGTIGPIVRILVGLKARSLIDQVVVIDAGSKDGTAQIAQRAGAEVYQESELLPQFGPVIGKGDAIWRALSVLTGDVICYIHSDSENFRDHFVRGLIGPILAREEIKFVKAFYRRPLQTGRVTSFEGGGRVTELVARPAINLSYPDLSGFLQPLAGEIAAERELLEKIKFEVGYAVEISQLIDIYQRIGLAGMAQVDLEVRQNRHHTLAGLIPMSYSILTAIAVRLRDENKLTILPDEIRLVKPGFEIETKPLKLVERPPYVTVKQP